MHISYYSLPSKNMYVAAVIFIFTKMNMVVFFFLINFRLLLCLCQRLKIENKLGRVGGSYIIGRFMMWFEQLCMDNEELYMKVENKFTRLYW
jgi:hypothetical protein